MADKFELELFLASRGISQEIIEKLKSENIDVEVLSVMSDHDLQQLGIVRLGDRIALRVFCNISFRSRSTGRNCMEATAIEDVCTERVYEEYIDLVGDGEDDKDEDLQDALMNSLIGSSSPDAPSDEVQLTAKEILQSFQAKYKECGSGTVNTIVVSRRKLLQSVRRALAKSDFSFYNPVKVYFSGEDAQDEGGPTREFFTLLMKTIGTEMGILEGMPKNRIFTHNIELLRLGQYQLAGQLVTWSIANGGPGLACLSSQMICLMCGESLKDHSAAAQHIPDDIFHSIIQEVLSVNSEDEMASAIHKWASKLIDNGVVNQHRLSLKDRDTVASDLITNYLKFRISAELLQFTTGLGELWNLFMAYPSILKDLFLFNDVSISFQRLRQLYSINWAEQGSHRRAQQEDAVYNFETFLQDCDSGTNCVALPQVLAFWTGSEAEPPLGFQAPVLMMSERQSSDKPLLVDFYDDPGRLPYASTCALCMWLPVNVTDTIFKALLLRSLTECVGFGKI